MGRLPAAKRARGSASLRAQPGRPAHGGRSFNRELRQEDSLAGPALTGGAWSCGHSIAGQIDHDAGPVVLVVAHRHGPAHLDPGSRAAGVGNATRVVTSKAGPSSGRTWSVSRLRVTGPMVRSSTTAMTLASAATPERSNSGTLGLRLGRIRRQGRLRGCGARAASLTGPAGAGRARWTGRAGGRSTTGRCADSAWPGSSRPPR